MIALECAAPDLPLVPPAYLRLLVSTARAEGVALDAWLMPLGLDAAALSSREAPATLALWRGLILGLQRLTQRPGLAIRLGRRVPLLAHGPLAYLMVSAADLRQTLDALVRFAPLRLAVLDIRLRERGPSLELQLRPRVALGDVERFMIDYLLAMLCTMLEQLATGLFETALLRLPDAQADAAGLWTEQGIRVERCTGWPVLLIPRTLASAALPTASARDHLRAWAACEDAEREQGWSGSISSRIEQLFRAGQASSYSLAEIAKQLGVSARTVMRRLDDEGTCFSELVDTSRQQRLLRRLAERRLGLAEIAEELGYADAAVLSRAVQRWFGCSPRALQLQLETGAALLPMPVTKSKFAGAI